jgi:hypothetical protein
VLPAGHPRRAEATRFSLVFHVHRWVGGHRWVSG